MVAQPQHVFISYSRRNTEVMLRISHALQQANIPVWTDERLTAGTLSWKNTIEHAIQSAFCMVVLMSPAAKTSEWVERELDYAYMLQCPIYPVLVDGSQRDAVPFELINVQYIDVRTDFDHRIQQLVHLLTPFATAAGVPHGPAKAQPAAPVVVPDSAPEISSEQVSALDLLLHLLGLNQEVSESATRYIAWSRLLVRWYFFEPRRFRIFSAIVRDSSARLVHASVTALVCLWLLGSAGLLYLVRIPQASFYLYNDLILFMTVTGYSMVIFVPLVAPYRTRRGFLGSILYALIILALLGGLFVIATSLIEALQRMFEGM